MTSTPRRTAPRAAALSSSLVLHAVLLAVAAAIPTSIVAAADPPPADEGPAVMAWIVPERRADVVVATPPARTRDVVPAAAPAAARIEPVVFEEPVLPPRVEKAQAADDYAPSPRPAPHATVSLHPGRGGARRGPGGAGGGGIGVGSGGGGGGDGNGTGGGTGLGWGEGDAGDGTGIAARGGPTRGPSITTSLAPPPYPRTARSRGWEGRVVLVLAIGADGHVVSAEVAESSGHEDLDVAAREAASDWTFAPALEDGEPVAGTLRVPVRFELTN